MYHGGFLSPHGQEIYKSITSLEVTFKKVTFKVLMNSCSLGATRTPARVQSTSALERGRLVFSRSCGHWFKWSVGLNEEDQIMGCIDQYRRLFFFSSFCSIFTLGYQTSAAPPPKCQVWLSLFNSRCHRQTWIQATPPPCSAHFRARLSRPWRSRRRRACAGQQALPTCPQVGLALRELLAASWFINKQQVNMPQRALESLGGSWKVLKCDCF